MCSLAMNAAQATEHAPVLQVIFFPSRPGYNDPAVTRRIMDYTLFMNSKVLFKQVSCLSMPRGNSLLCITYETPPQQIFLGMQRGITIACKHTKALTDTSYHIACSRLDSMRDES